MAEVGGRCGGPGREEAGGLAGGPGKLLLGSVADAPAWLSTVALPWPCWCPLVEGPACPDGWAVKGGKVACWRRLSSFGCPDDGRAGFACLWEVLC